jgi:hypothetical protein
MQRFIPPPLPPPARGGEIKRKNEGDDFEKKKPCMAWLFKMVPQDDGSITP